MSTSTPKRFNRNLLTPEQKERLSHIKNFQQLKALRNALTKREPIPDYAWTPVPEEFDCNELLRVLITSKFLNH